MEFSLGYGKSLVRFEMPPGVDCTEIAYRAERQEDEAALIQQALKQPIGSMPLQTLAAGKRSAVILISDASRLSPSHKFLPLLLDELREGGLSLSQIQVVVALGMHRKQTERELKELVGEAVYDSVQVMNHSALPADCVSLGTTALGTPVEIFRPVAESELRIATGNIEPHGLAGVSGGVKALMPGVSSQRSIQHNHSFSMKWKTHPGDPENPIRKDMEEALQFLPIHFLFNTVVNHRQEILGAAAGDIKEAHRILADQAKKNFLVPIHRKFEAVIASAGGHPKDMQLYQAVKSLQNASKVVKPGGKILLIAECKEMFGNGLFQYWVETVQNPTRITQMMKEEFVLGAHKVTHIEEVLRQHEVYFYSEIPESTIELLGFKPVADLQGCIDQFVQNGSVAVMPYAALTFPVYNE